MSMKERFALLGIGILLGLFYAYVWTSLPLWFRGMVLVVWVTSLIWNWYKTKHRK